MLCISRKEAMLLNVSEKIKMGKRVRDLSCDFKHEPQTRAIMHGGGPTPTETDLHSSSFQNS